MRHPKGVFLLFIVHAFERFGFWGMRSLLVLYLIETVAEGGVNWTEQRAIAFTGFYAGFIYMTPLLGGRIADGWLGARRSILLGGGLMAMGIFLLSLQIEGALMVALGCIALGNGFFKPCLTSLVGRLYGSDHPLREKGYHYLYMTVLIGVLTSGLLCGWIQPNYGFPLAFIIAATATTLATAIFFLMPEESRDRCQNKQKVYDKKPLSVDEKKRVCMIMVLATFAVIFFAAHAQGGGLLTVYIHRYTSRTICGWEIPTLWLISLGTFFGLFLTPLFGSLWQLFGRFKREPTFIEKFVLGLVFTGIAFAIMTCAAVQRGMADSQLSSVYWLLGYHFAYISGKTVVIPVLWSTVEKLAPRRYRFLMMGVIMGSISVGNVLGGQIGALIKGVSFENVFAGLSIMCVATAAILIVVGNKAMKTFQSEQTFG